MSQPPQQLHALMEAVERLWPDSTVEFVRRGGTPSTPGVGRGGRTPDSRADSTGDELEKLTVVPNASNPRMLIPQGRHAGANAIARYNAAIGPRELIGRFGATLAFRAGAAKLLGDQIWVSGDSAGITGHLNDLLGEKVSVSIAVGSLRANRKPVLGIFDRRGRLVAYAKIGDTGVARRHVMGEADALRLVNDADLSTMRVPEIIGAGEWQSLYVLVMSALPTGALQPPGDRRSRPPVSAMDELSAAFDGGWTALADSPLMKSCVQVAEGLGESPRADRLRACLEAVIGRHGGTEVRCGAWHGDFTPWNMAYRRGGPISVWDWERFDEDGLFGLDRLHFVSQTQIRAASFSTDVLLDALSSAKSHGEPLGAHKATMAAYLVTLACRYVAASVDEGGDAIVANAETVLEVLARTSSGTE